MTNAEMMARAYGLIDDPKGKFVAEAEMSLHLEEVARDFAARTRVMRQPAKLVSYLTTGYLTLPEDCEELLKVLRSDGTEIRPLSAAQMRLAYGEDWETQEGEPDHYTRDLTGPDKIRFSHIPTATGDVTLSYVQGHVVGSEDGIEIPSKYHVTLIWGTAAKALAKSSNPGDQVKLAQFSAAYEAGVLRASSEASRSWSRHARTIPYSNF